MIWSLPPPTGCRVTKSLSDLEDSCRDSSASTVSFHSFVLFSLLSLEISTGFFSFYFLKFDLSAGFLSGLLFLEFLAQVFFLVVVVAAAVAVFISVSYFSDSAGLVGNIWDSFPRFNWICWLIGWFVCMRACGGEERREGGAGFSFRFFFVCPWLFLDLLDGSPWNWLEICVVLLFLSLYANFLRQRNLKKKME